MRLPPRPPPVPGPHNPLHDQGHDAEARRSVTRTGNEVEEEGFAAGPGEQCTGDEQGTGDRNGSLLVRCDEAADRDGLELGKSAINAYMHLLSFMKDVGERVCRSAPDTLRLGSGAAVEKAGWGVAERRTTPRVVFSTTNKPRVPDALRLG